MTRKDRAGITEKVLSSGADLIFTGGEMYAIPEGVVGVHGREGIRKDGRNLLTEAKAAGYTVIYTQEELLKLPSDANKVIGMFAAKDTYNSKTEEVLKERGLPLYNEGQPTFDEMVSVALNILSSDPAKRFFLVAEEEGTDNFSNSANTPGVLEALKRSDKAIGLSMDFIQSRPVNDTLLIVGADSDAGHPTIWTPVKATLPENFPLFSETGAPLDGVRGTGSMPFETAPDANGNTFLFSVAWPMKEDGYGSVVAKAHGYGSEALNVVVDNTDIYRISYKVLFGKEPGQE